MRLAARAGSAGSQFDLTLLRPAPGTEAAWLKAWKAIIPARFDEDELLGLKFAGRLDGTVPGFRWPIMVEQGFPKGFIEPDSVQIARKDLRVELVSPNEQGDIDGVAPLAEPGEGGTSDDNNWVKAKKTGTTIEFTLGRTIAAAASITIDCAKDAVAMKSAGSFDLKVNVDRLATDLRTVYGLQTPPPVPAIKEGERAGPAFGQPLIPAFVPLDDGWLQLPIPNLGLVDTSSDPTLVVDPSTRRKRSVDRKSVV